MKDDKETDKDLEKLNEAIRQRYLGKFLFQNFNVFKAYISMIILALS